MTPDIEKTHEEQKETCLVFGGVFSGEGRGIREISQRL